MNTDLSIKLIVTKISFNGIQGLLTHGYDIGRLVSLDYFPPVGCFIMNMGSEAVTLLQI